ncbi:MAG TPA: hypothetical protein VMH30_07155 [Verrucomicrobiae bacterium]|nr:hypothetical protein [Verrucomicrobiae bacterium]
MSSKSNHLLALQAAIQLKHQCRPVHRESVFVHETAGAQETVWKGNVEVFDLTGHKVAKICYAWQHIQDDGDVKIFTILGNHFIDSPNRAVQAAILMDKQPAPYPRRNLRP